MSQETSSAFLGELVDTAELLTSCLDLPILEVLHIPMYCRYIPMYVDEYYICCSCGVLAMLSVQTRFIHNVSLYSAHTYIRIYILISQNTLYIIVRINWLFDNRRIGL